MNILFLSMTFPDAISPERGTYNIELCEALARQHRVEVIAPRSWHEWLQARRRGGRGYSASAKARSAGLSVAYPVYWYVPKLKPQMLGAAMWQSIRRGVQRLGRSFRPDVVISYWAFPDGAAGQRIAEHFGVPSIVIAGGSDVLLLPKEPGRGPAVEAVLRQSSMVVTVSEGLRRATIALGARPERVKTILQGVDPSIFHPGAKADARRALGLPQDAEILLWVGRMVGVKNLDFLLAAMGPLVARRPRLKLFLLGDGEVRPGLERRAAVLGIAGSAKFVGPRGHDVLPDWYRAADVTVLTSHSEGLPNVLRESLACGTPFVATDVGNIREIAEPAFSRLVPAGDEARFGAAVEEMLRPQFHDAAQHYEARTWTACARDFTSLIDDLCQKKAA